MHVKHRLADTLRRYRAEPAYVAGADGGQGISASKLDFQLEGQEFIALYGGPQLEFDKGRIVRREL